MQANFLPDEANEAYLVLHSIAMNKHAETIQLHLGCGEIYLNEYINVDYPPTEHSVMQVKTDVYADITQMRLPIGSIDEIRLHHVFEHFSRVTALSLLIKWQDWLKVGGLLRMETPDLLGSAHTFMSTKSYKVRMGIARALAGDQSSPWGYHIDHWFPERFERTLGALGFAVMETKSTSWSNEPFLSNVEVFALKTRNVSLEEQLAKTDELLWESTVSDNERETYETWKRQLRDLF